MKTSVGAALLLFLVAGSANAATIGGSITAISGSGACTDIKSVPLNTVQDSFALSGLTSCSGGSATVDIKGDAVTASIGLLAESSGNGTGSSLAATQVQLTDTWTITAPSSAGTTFYLPVSITVEGNIEAGSIYDASFGRFLDYGISISDQFGSSIVSSYGQVTATGTFLQVVTGVLAIPSFAPKAFISLSLFAPALFEGEINFFNTASIKLDLPEGYSVRTSSGKALDFGAAPSPVPLPAALPLLAAGLSGMGLMGWRRRKAVT